jgi:hypothetical protein
MTGLRLEGSFDVSKICHFLVIVNRGELIVTVPGKGVDHILSNRSALKVNLVRILLRTDAVHADSFDFIAG